MAVAAAIAGAAVVGGATSIIGANKQANAQEAAGNAQAQSAREQLDFQKKVYQETLDRKAAAAKTAGKSPEEIASINRLLEDKTTALNASLGSIDKQQKLLDSLSPSIKQSGDNMLDLLQGKTSPMLAPLQAERDRQRKIMQGNLAGSLGPGYATTSAGIEAMTRFDSETANTMMGAQMSAISEQSAVFQNLFGTALTGQSNVTGATQSAYDRANLADQSVLQAEQFATTRQSNANMGAASADSSGMTQAGNNVVGSAGAPFAGQATMGQAIGQIGGSILGGAEKIGIGSLMSPTGGGYGTLPGTSAIPANFGATFGQSAYGQYGGPSLSVGTIGDTGVAGGSMPSLFR